MYLIQKKEESVLAAKVVIMESVSQIVTYFTYFKICSLALCHLSQE